MEELDLLKKDWQRIDKSFEVVSETSIYKMLQQKSSSIVRTIFIISIAEVLFWTLLNAVSFGYDDFEAFINGEFGIYFKLFSVFNYAVVGYFIYRFYVNYKTISTLESTKKLMDSILSTHKVVKQYVGYNLAMIGLSVLVGVFVAVAKNDSFDHIISDPKLLIYIIVVSILIMAVFIVVFWLFYRLLYGILLKRLKNNYNELKKIDL
jgi:hypothetical protein